MLVMFLGRPESPFRTGLCFTRDVFLFSHISEVPRPIAAKLYHMIGIWLKRSRKLQKFAGRSPKKYRGPKTCKISVDFLHRPTYLRNGLRYPNQKGTFSISIFPAF